MREKKCRWRATRRGTEDALGVVGHRRRVEGWRTGCGGDVLRQLLLQVVEHAKRAQQHDRRHAVDVS